MGIRMKWNKPQILRSPFIAILLLTLSVWRPANAAVDITFEELSQLSGETTEKVTEIRLAREAARERGFRLATYGGTSREVADFIISKVNELGSVAKYRTWLAGKERIHLLDFHKINSDLDFMVIPIGTNGDRSHVGELIHIIHRDFLFNIDMTSCQFCRGEIKVVSAVMEKAAIDKILNHLGLPTETPIIHPARPPPQAELDFTQVPSSDFSDF